MKLKLKIINLDGIYFDGEVDLLNITVASGNITVLAGHIPLISSIKISIMYTSNDHEKKYYAIAGGTLFVDENGAKIITNAIEREDEIDFERAELSRKRAQERLSLEKDDIDIQRAQVSLQRALNRLRLK